MLAESVKSNAEALQIFKKGQSELARQSLDFTVASEQPIDFRLSIDSIRSMKPGQVRRDEKFRQSMSKCLNKAFVPKID